MNVGILGGGQLGRMIAQRACSLDIAVRVLDPDPRSPAARIASHLCAEFEDRDALDRFADGVDVVTCEWESVPQAALQHLADRVPLRPSAFAIAAGQDRAHEKALFSRLQIPTPSYELVESQRQLEAAADRVGMPAVLKTRHLGYDGKGQAVLRTPGDLEPTWRKLGGQPLILESFVPFDRELSVIAVCGVGGAIECYPLVQNRHVDGILAESIAPAPGISTAMAEAAGEYVRRIARALEYVGVLTLEMFALGDRLWANEIAPRVHNSGHWTLDAGCTDQFENHLRAVCGFPLGSTRPVGTSILLNIVSQAPPIGSLLALPGVHLHLYGKSPRPGRKLGHLTVRGDDLAAAQSAADAARSRLLWPAG